MADIGSARSRRDSMPSYLFVYRAREASQPDPDATTAWESWFGEIGDSIVDIGNPVFGERRALGDDACETQIRGYSIVAASDGDAAAALARGCPLLQRGGAVEIAELTPLDGAAMPATAGRTTQAA
jgi:hypothetical protein